MSETVRADWGQWGVHTFEDFLSQYRRSPELRLADLDGIYSYETVIGDIIKEVLTGKVLTNVPYSQSSGLCVSLSEFARRTVPIREQAPNGDANTFNPCRNNRLGAAASVPNLAPDVFEWLLEGRDEQKRQGHAIVVEFDQDADDIDDLLSRDARARQIASVDAHAVCIVNKYSTYVRVMDQQLEALLQGIGFTPRKSRPDESLRAIPHGVNLVAFPFTYADSMSTMSVYDLFSVLLAAQRGINRVKTIASTEPYEVVVFVNIKPLAGGTQPRIHVQVYIRTRTSAGERYLYHEDGVKSEQAYPKDRRVQLIGGNRSWQVFAPRVRGGQYDIRLEPLKAHDGGFQFRSASELWDLAEALIFHSHLLDANISIPERNILIFPQGVLIRAFAVVGGFEGIVRDHVCALPPEVFADDYNNKAANVRISKTAMYKEPRDFRGQELFRKLVDPNSPIVAFAA